MVPLKTLWARNERLAQCIRCKQAGDEDSISRAVDEDSTSKIEGVATTEVQVNIPDLVGHPNNQKMASTKEEGPNTVEGPNIVEGTNKTKGTTEEGTSHNKGHTSRVRGQWGADPFRAVSAVGSLIVHQTTVGLKQRFVITVESKDICQFSTDCQSTMWKWKQVKQKWKCQSTRSNPRWSPCGSRGSRLANQVSQLIT